MPKKSVSSPSRKKKSAKIKGKQSSLLGHGDKFIQRIRISKEALLIDKDILLGEEIYGNRVPEDMVGKLFHYQVTGYDSRTKKFTAAYKNRMIVRNGSSWEHQDGNREVMGDLGLESVEKGQTLYNVKFSDVRTNELALETASKAILKKKGEDEKDNKEIDFTDLEEAAGSDGNWFGMPVIEAMFELTGETGVTANGGNTRTWRLKNKDIDYKFNQQMNIGGKSWNTGVFKRKLETLSKGKFIGRRNADVVARAKFLLSRRAGHSAFDANVPVVNLKFFPFEEDLDHQIREALIICSTGTSTSFFNNSFVRDYIKALEPRHCLVYRLKLVRIIRCIMDTLQDEINNFLIECFLLYRSSFVASTSDFWHHPVWKTSFGATVANFMAPGYIFRNGLFLAVSDTTKKRLHKSGTFSSLIRSGVSKLHRTQALMDFCEFDHPKTGTNIGEWLLEAHSSVGCKPEYISSHTVDGAANAGAALDCLEWNTRGLRSQKVVAHKCDAHKINTTSAQASGTSKHVTNLNPDLGASLSRLHLSVTRVLNYKACKDVFKNVQQENGREKTLSLKYSVLTRWNSSYDETQHANCNQHDLNIALRRIRAPGGAAENILETENDTNDEANKYPTSDDWEVYLQYEAAMAPMKRYSSASQSSGVIAHEELFWGRSTIEQMSAHFFLMHENLSAKKIGSSMVKDLTKRELNQLVIEDCFELPFNEASDKYHEMEEHSMLECIRLCRRLAARLLGLRMGFFKRVSTISRRDNQDLDTDINTSIMAGLEDKKCLSEIKIMGALLNPLYQSKSRMIEGGLCTEHQYMAGKAELLDRLSHFYEGQEQEVTSAIRHESTNEWDDIELLDSTNANKTPLQKAEDEYNLYCVYMQSSYLPRMESSKLLGAYTLEGDPKKEPVYSIGAVVEKGDGKNLPGGHNHAEYVDKTGHYDIVQYLEDHKHKFPAIYMVCVGQICPHISTEVDCESLFSEAGFLADPRRSLTNVRLYERLVIVKHRLGRIYCHIPTVKELYLRHWKENDWDEHEERDTHEFLELEKEIYLEMFPQNEQLVEDDDEDDEEKCVEVSETSTKRKRNCIEGEFDDSSDDDDNNY